jgi:hypothetical protein
MLGLRYKEAFRIFDLKNFYIWKLSAVVQVLYRQESNFSLYSKWLLS